MSYDIYAHEDGYNAGNVAGFQEGLSTGREQGYNSGYNDGCQVGYNKGHKDGYDKGHTAGWNACVEKASEQIWIGNENIRILEVKVYTLLSALKESVPLLPDELQEQFAEALKIKVWEVGEYPGPNPDPSSEMT